MRGSDSSKRPYVPTNTGEARTLADLARLLLEGAMDGNPAAATVEQRLAGLPRATAALVAVVQQDESLYPEATPKLTPRLREILEMLGAGKTPKEIRQELHISEKTVRSHIEKLREIFEVRTYKEASRKARRMGLL